MAIALKVIVGVFCLPLLLLGFRAMFKPANMAEAMAIAPQGPAGLNTVRSVIGGLFLACVLMLTLGLISGQTVWYLAVTIVMGFVVLGRIVGVMGDGYDKAILPPLVIEIVIACVLVAAHLAQDMS